MIPGKFEEVLKHEGVVAIVTQGEESPHLINTWNSYITMTNEGDLLIPAGGMKETEKNTMKLNKVQISLGSRDVEGFNGPGTGFLILGRADFLKKGSQFDTMKERFPWIRAVLKVTIDSIRKKYK